MSESFSERVARIAAERAGSIPEEPPPVEHDEDVIPEVEYDRSDADVEIDRVIDGIDIIDAYAKWCGKMTPKVGNKRESIMISCPNPDHPDKNPSAWINLDKGTWFCGSCDEGGDKFDLAAIHFGIDDYKSGRNFPLLRQRIAEEEGYVVMRTAGGTEYLEKATIEDEPEPVGQPDATPMPPSDELAAEPDPEPSSLAARIKKGHERIAAERAAAASRLGVLDPDRPVLTIVPDAESVPDEEVLDYPVINWRRMLTGDTFLSRWMESTSRDDVTEEFYFWLGMQALGLAAGRDIYLADSPPVYANLFVCLFGPSGDGKSRSIGPLLRLLDDAMPYDPMDEFSKGVYLVPTPGSAESLVDSFSKPIYDPADPKKISMHAPVRGLVRMDELSTLTGRSARAGSVMKPTLMEFFDCYRRVELKTRGAGHVIAAEPFASLVTTTQPRAIRELVSQTDADSGFLNRWIFASGEGKKRNSFGRTPISTDRCIEPLRAVRSWAATTEQVTLSDEALDVWDGFFHDTVIPARKADDSDLLTRSDLHLKKIMLLLALDRAEEVISITTMMDALSMWDYLNRSYEMLGGHIGMGPFEDARRVILDAIVAHEKRSGKGMTTRELGRVLERKHVPIDVAYKLLPMMVSLEQISEELVKPTRGPTTTRYRVASGE